MNGLRFRITSLLIPSMVVCLAVPVIADDAVERGATAVEQWCRLCHLRVSDGGNPDMAPPFEDIVKRPGRDRAFFRRFLREDHFPMTTFRLFDDEKADVVVYLMHLQGAAE